MDGDYKLCCFDMDGTKILQATLKDFNTIYEIVDTTINKIYQLYYPMEVVQFFLNHHSIDNIKNALAVEYILLIELDGRIIGTGSIFKNEIKRMFILPEFQGRGYGSVLLKELEHNAENEGYDTIILDASLPGYSLYEKRGYKSVKYNKIVTPKGHVLCYNQMSKVVKNSNLLIDYNNRIFTSISNSDNGEVSNKTIFKYNQQDNIIWAEYFGGEIVKGYLIGTSDIDGKLYFCYQHINTKKQIRTGKCNSTPEILNGGRIKLFEEWEWTNGALSKGSSIIEEISK